MIKVTQVEDKGSQADDIAKRNDSCTIGQVMPSISNKQEARGGCQSLLPSTGGELNNQNHELSLTLEDKIMEKVSRHMKSVMEYITQNFGKMIK